MTRSTVKFVIVGTQRTGTTLIRTSLSSHPDVFCAGEAFLLGRRPYRKPDGYWQFRRQSVGRRLKSLSAPESSAADFLDHLYRDGDYSAAGFKLMLSHCRLRPWLWPLLESRGVRAILVHRINPLKTLVSRLTAAKSGVYHVSGEHKAPTIEIDTANLIRDLDSIGEDVLTWRKMLDNSTDYIEIAYEEYLEDQVGKNQEIQQFLQVPHATLSSNLKKVNPDDLSRVIDNYDDVIETLRNTGYSRHLPE